MQVAVVGVGQSLRGDDAIGLEVLRQWQGNFPETANRPEVRVEACEMPGLALLDLLQDVDAAIFVDAIQGTFPIGTVHLLDENELAAFLSDAKSAHGWGLAETLKLGSALTGVKVNVRVIGIQIEQTAIGAWLSKAVQDAIPIACEVLQKEVDKLLH
ncbi:MAG: hydrogenase maturation protease [Anaerolineales bacterium]